MYLLISRQPTPFLTHAYRPRDAVGHECPLCKPKPDAQNYRDLRNLKSVRTSSFPAPGFAVVRQHLRGAADAAPKGFIERDAAKPPAVRPAGPVDLPLRGPSVLMNGRRCRAIRTCIARSFSRIA